MLKGWGQKGPEAMYLYTSFLLINTLCDQLWTHTQRNSVTLKAPIHDDCAAEKCDCFESTPAPEGFVTLVKKAGILLRSDTAYLWKFIRFDTANHLPCTSISLFPCAWPAGPGRLLLPDACGQSSCCVRDSCTALPAWYEIATA